MQGTYSRQIFTFYTSFKGNLRRILNNAGVWRSFPPLVMAKVLPSQREVRWWAAHSNRYFLLSLLTRNVKEVFLQRKKSKICDSAEILGKASVTSGQLLPSKSKHRYEAAFEQLMRWRSVNNDETFSENVFRLVYFKELSKKYTLWSIFSMLKAI